MASRIADASRLAERFHQVSLAGLALSGYLALAGSGFFDLLSMALGAAGVVFLIAVSTFLTSRTGRGFVFIQAFACLELLAAALLSEGWSFMLYLAIFVFFLLAAQAGGEIRRSSRGRAVVAGGGARGFHLRLGGLIACAGIGILALTAALFFVLPRTASAALQRLVSGRYYLPGFSGEVRLGQMGAILNRDTPAMHIRTAGWSGPQPLRWRGAVLTSFDGRNWRAPESGERVIQVSEGRSILAEDDQRRRPGARITYEIQLEAINSDVLFFAGVPEVLWIGMPRVRESPAQTYQIEAAPRRRLRYGAISYLGEYRPSPAPPDGYLELPALDRRITALAREVTSGQPSDEARARALESYLARTFGYTTDLPREDVPDPLAHFLFERRAGHCEYFASAMAVMLRSIGIPSRLVTGFVGGQLNPVTGWRLVRASDAHAWVEAWIGGRGWTVFDPTPAGRARREAPLLARFRMYADAAQMFWQDWVVDYDLERQIGLAARMQGSGRVAGERWLEGFRLGFLRWQGVAARALRVHGLQALAVCLLAAALCLVAPKAGRFYRYRRRFRKAQSGSAVASDASLLYRRMLEVFRRRGYQKPAWATPGEFVSGLPPSEAAELAAGLTAAYHELRYGGRTEAAARMIAFLERLEHAAPAGSGRGTAA
ncbi:MAG: DUF3488 domain-containing protein [Bryobacterales bacterium]|nr:DUF3488 domain-containing protein [Bryobacterales bacterium]